MTNNQLLSNLDINNKLSELTELLETKLSQGQVNEIEDEKMQNLMEKMIQLYGAKLENEDHYEPFHKIRPIPANPKLTQTETAIFVDQLIKRMEIEVFELQMWRSLR
jgi:methyltransferase-like protein